jgi:hypothetical protein
MSGEFPSLDQVMGDGPAGRPAQSPVKMMHNVRLLKAALTRRAEAR